MPNKKPASRQALENLKRIPVDTDAPQERWSARRRILATVAACALTLSMIPAAGLATGGAAGTAFDQPEVNDPTAAETVSSSDQPIAGEADQTNKASENNSPSEKNNENSASKESDQTPSDSSKQPATPETNENDDAATSTPKSDTKDAEKAASTPESIVDEKTPLTENALTNSASTPIPETKVFTDAGPFLPPVNVGAPLRAKAARQVANEATTQGNGQESSSSNGTEQDNGLELSKTVKANADGTYTISLDAYTTGKVTTTTKSVPVDIVLVLDQSGSMAYDFDGNSLVSLVPEYPFVKYDYEKSRQYALKRAVTKFIDAVGEKYNAEDADHRIAIVTFASMKYDWFTPTNGYTLISGLTNADQDGVANLKLAVNGLDNRPDGATRIDEGMKKAEALFGGEYEYTGGNKERQKVVIAFTDGEPTNSSSFEDEVANAALQYGVDLKASGTTVYSVGIFNGANPNIVESGDTTAKTNRFLNYLSSNFESANDLAEIYKRNASDYYLTAASSTDLNNIFQKISENIHTPSISLGSETVIKDTVSEYFDIPSLSDGTTEIELYTADAQEGGKSFKDRAKAPEGVTAEVAQNNDGTKAVSITGFDFNANFVSDKPKNEKGTDFGKKLIIEFTVKPKEGFAGGNDVPTNVPEASGIFDKDNNEIEKFATDDTTPKVNVPISQNELEKLLAAHDRTVYKGQTIKSSDLWEKSVSSDWAFKFVNVTPNVTGETEGVVQPESCGPDDVVLACTPISDGTNAEGKPNAAEGVTITKQAQVHVLKSELKASKVTKYYGESYTLGEGANVSINWKDAESHANAPKPDGKAPYDSSSPLSYEAVGFSGEQGTIPAESFDVTVKASDGTNDIDVGTYRVDVKTCTLKITKQVQGNADGESFVFNVTNDGKLVSGQKLVINGAGSKTISGLPVGTYNVQEDENWSWRYEATGSGSVQLSPSNPDGGVTIVNTKDNQRWISSEASCNNIFVGNAIATKVVDIAAQAAAQVAGE